MVKDETPEQKPEEKPEDTQKVVATGKVKVQSGRLNVRSGPSTAYKAVTSLGKGEAVTIYEIKKVGAMEWGRIDKGWISMTYVALDKTETDDNTQTPEQKPEEKPEDKPEQKPEQKPETNTPTAVTGKVVVTSGHLNIRSGAGTNYGIVGWLKAGETVTITEQKTAGGLPWGKTAKGWVCMNYITVTSSGNGGNSDNNDSSNNGGDTSDNDSATVIKGKVSSNGSMLRVRTGPGSSYAIAGYLEDGTAVEILEQKKVGATTWARIDKGWISMNFVELDENAPVPEQKPEEKPSTITGTVIADVLNVRSGAGTHNRIVGSLLNGQKVTILETKMVGNVKWGRISNGWISMDYIK